MVNGELGEILLRCDASRGGERFGVYIWNIFGNLVAIFFFIWNARGTFFLRFNSGRKSFVRGKIFSRVKSGMKRRLCVILVLCSKIVSSK